MFSAAKHAGTCIAAVLTTAVGLASCGEHGTVAVGSANETLVIAYSVTANGELAQSIPVRLESLELGRLDELRGREGLATIVSEGASEFEQVLLLKEWVASQWPAGFPNPYPPWDAIVILDWIRQGVTGGFCAQYAQVMLQSLAALGMQARYVELGSTVNPYAHFVMEVWSNQFNKWVVIDADYNLHFERDGIPLSALEVHEALARNELAEVSVVLGTRRLGHSDATLWPLQTAELYYYLRYHLKANHLAAPQEAPFDRYNDMVEWLDELTVPWELSQVDSPYPKQRLTNLQTADRALVESRINQVSVAIESNSSGVIAMRLDNNVHDFRGYEFRLLARPGQDSPWQPHDRQSMTWRPNRAARILEIRGVNVSGVAGPVSRVTVFFGGTDR
jgi:hypothetical protein